MAASRFSVGRRMWFQTSSGRSGVRWADWQLALLYGGVSGRVSSGGFLPAGCASGGGCYGGLATGLAKPVRLELRNPSAVFGRVGQPGVIAG